MKKYFTSPDYKRRQRILQEQHENASPSGARPKLGRDQWKTRSIGSASQRRKLEKKQRGVLEGRQLIVAPSDFRIKENCEEMLQFFSLVYRSVQMNQAMFFDLSEIRLISADAILYMVSAFQYYFEVHKYAQIVGNYPNDPACRQLLIESGFLDYVKSSAQLGRKAGGILSIRSDCLVQGEIAHEVVTFAEDKLRTEDRPRLKNIYATIIECMANTKHHAYSKEYGLRKWWLMALPAEDKRRVHFAFLDNGVGIPATIRQNYSERVRKVVGKGPTHGELIHSALLGAFRTKTGQVWRGKGLPKIHTYATIGTIGDLTVISGNGFVDVNSGRRDHMSRKFYGTLLSWDFV